MEIRQSSIKSIIPVVTQQQTEKVNSAQSKTDSRILKQHYPPGHPSQSQPTFNSPPAKKIADGLKQLEVKQPISDFSINTRNLNALNAYTEELNQPLQKQISMLAGIDFYV